MTLKELKKEIINNDDLNQSDLHYIKQLVEWKMKKNNILTFKTGQKVSFENKGSKYFGYVLKIMKKNIKVQVTKIDNKEVGMGNIWHCFPSNLKEVA